MGRFRGSRSTRAQVEILGADSRSAPLADLCLALEKAGKADDMPEISAQMPQLTPAFEAVRTEIEAMR